MFFKFKNLNYLFFIIILLFFPFLTKAEKLEQRLQGQIVLQVEEQGQAWYIDSLLQQKIFLGSPDNAFQLIKILGKGISDQDLEKIPISLKYNFDLDTDQDNLSDKIEDSLGTNKIQIDSDQDGYNDGLEIINNYNPLKSDQQKLNIDLNFAKKFQGKILLQTEKNGEAWYVNPKNYYRHYIGSPKQILDIMINLGLGISNQDLEKISNLNLKSYQSLKQDYTKKRIEINTKEQKLTYFFDNEKLGEFAVSTGKPSMPTPKGSFKIDSKHPKAWSNTYKLWMPYWMSLRNGYFGIHELPIWPSGFREGSNHLGKAVSHGCIRLDIGPAEFLYQWTPINTEVIIK